MAPPDTTGPLIGMIVVAFFAVCWVFAGSRSLGRGWAASLTLAAVVISTALVWHGGLALRRGAGHALYFDGLAYGLAVGFESTAIPLAIVILRRLGKLGCVLPAVALIVGVHFFGLIWAFRSAACGWLGGAMCLLALASLVGVPETLESRQAKAGEPIRPRDVVVGLGCAVILWCSVLLTF